MGRPPAFTPDEDAIILATLSLSAEETNRLLVEGGHKKRTDGSIYGRRNYLKEQARSGEQNIQDLIERREALRRVFETARDAYAEITALVDNRLGAYQKETKDSLADLAD